MISVDAGGFFQPAGPDSTGINELLTEALSRIPVGVLNLNSDDLEIWPTLSQGALAQTEVISTNLRPPSSVAAPDRYAVKTIKVGEVEVRIGFLGLADTARVPPRSGFTGIDPLEAVAGIKGKVLEQADFLMVLADLPDELIDQLAKANPEIYVVVAMERRFVLSRPRQVENAVILKTVERGRFLGRLALDVDSNGKIVSYRPDLVEMNSKVPEAEFFVRRIDQLSSRYTAGAANP